jgi:hypothetical protein
MKNLIRALKEFEMFFSMFFKDLVIIVFFNKTFLYFIFTSVIFLLYLYLLLDRYFFIFWYEFYYIFFVYYHYKLFEAYYALLYNVFGDNQLFRFLFCVNVMFLLKNILVYCILYGCIILIADNDRSLLFFLVLFSVFLLVLYVNI